jgi:glycosyltransferase involved in cell wall biosynthesis
VKLAIISHTEHYKTTEGVIVGWSPTVNEVNHLLSIFDEIYHIAMLHEGEIPPSVMPYKSNKIHFIALPPLGGKTLSSKFKLVFNAAKVIKTVKNTLKKIDYFQLRTPTGIGVYLIPYLTFFSKKKGWYKYAGNWNQKKPPLGYVLQRCMLKQQNKKVTINGMWQNQPKHCITFENPCLTIEDVYLGQQIATNKNLNQKVSFCYVGRLEKEKGVERIIRAFTKLDSENKLRVDKVHLVGNGEDLQHFKRLSKNCGVTIIFHGFLSHDEVFEIYKKSHFFLMPTTASEGFPKVIAEALNFGCIPIVSNLSSIGQYIINNQNGFLLSPITVDNLVLNLLEVLKLTTKDYYKLLSSRKSLVEKFTFQYYNNRIYTQIIK